MAPIISEIRLFPFTDVPKDWLPCDGRLLPITSFMALFSLLETTYGGDGKTSFALPDLRGRIPVGIDREHPAGRAFAFEAGDAGETAAQPALALNFCIATEGDYPSAD